MEWEDKTKMVQLGNKSHESEQSKKEFQTFVLQHVSSFDNQAWDMFVQLTEIILKDMETDIDYWKQVYPHLKNVDCNDKSFGFRSGMRIAMIQTFCEEELKLTA